MVPVGSSKLSYLGIHARYGNTDSNGIILHKTHTHTHTHTHSMNHSLLSDILGVASVHHPDGFGQVPEHCRVLQVQDLRGVVTENPGELHTHTHTHTHTHKFRRSPRVVLHTCIDTMCDRFMGGFSPPGTGTGRCMCAQRWCSAASDTQNWKSPCTPISIEKERNTGFLQ